MQFKFTWGDNTERGLKREGDTTEEEGQGQRGDNMERVGSRHRGDKAHRKQVKDREVTTQREFGIQG